MDRQNLVKIIMNLPIETLNKIINLRTKHSNIENDEQAKELVTNLEKAMELLGANEAMKKQIEKASEIRDAFLEIESEVLNSLPRYLTRETVKRASPDRRKNPITKEEREGRASFILRKTKNKPMTQKEILTAFNENGYDIVPKDISNLVQRLDRIGTLKRKKAPKGSSAKFLWYT